MARIGSKIVTIVAAWFALCSAAFAADSQPAPAPQIMSASAGEPLPTASAVANDPTAQQIDAWLANDGAPAGAQSPGPSAPPPPRAIHGEAGVAIGSSGYRDAYVSADIPIGDRSDLGVSVSDTKLPSHHGYGGGEYKSLGVSLYIDTSKHGGDACQPRWGEPLPTDRAAPACAGGGGEAAGLMPGIQAMEAQAGR